MSDSLTSLLNFLDAPLMIGDPDGRVIWVNPAFEHTFGWNGDEVRGQALATLFDGGGREAVLGAVAEVCARGETIRFRLKKDDVGFLGVASPIEAEEGHVGVVILLTLEPDTDERLLAYQAEIAEPLDEVARCLEELLESPHAPRSDRDRGLIERGLAALTRAQKWSDEMRGALSGQRTERNQSVVDPVRVVRNVAQHVAEEGGHGGAKLHLLVPSSLPKAVADATMLETALLRLVRNRALESNPGSWLSLSARSAGTGADRRVLLSVVDRHAEEVDLLDGEPEPEPKLVRAAVSALGGDLLTWSAADVGRVTTIALPVVDPD